MVQSKCVNTPDPSLGSCGAGPEIPEHVNPPFMGANDLMKAFNSSFPFSRSSFVRVLSV